MQTFSQYFDLYLVTDRNQTRGRDLLWVVEQALKAGVKRIQLREKDLGGRDLLTLAEKIVDICKAYDASLIINNRIDVALAVNADGVHLGNGSLPVTLARELLGQDKLIGVSTHSLNQAKKAEQDRADFIVYGPVYFTPSKASYGKPQGLARLEDIVKNVSLPVYAIGGIKLENILDIKKTGIRGVAVISAVMNTADPLATTREILSLLSVTSSE